MIERIKNSMMYRLRDNKRKVLDRIMFPKSKCIIPDSTEIRDSVYIDNPERVLFGNNVFVNYGCNFHTGFGTKCNIILEDNVWVGQNTNFICASHLIGDKDKRAGTQTWKSIRVGKGTWIGGILNYTSRSFNWFWSYCCRRGSC